MTSLCPNITAARGALADDLYEQWKALRNDAHASRVDKVLACIAMLHRCGIFGDAARELWVRRLSTCPGHDDEGGRSWCSYCGDMPRRDADTTQEPPASDTSGPREPTDTVHRLIPGTESDTTAPVE